jgi:hypothetical protein
MAVTAVLRTTTPDVDARSAEELKPSSATNAPPFVTNERQALTKSVARHMK